jgi:inosine-uridine nucleoside N-ribohydrolase
MTSARFIDSDNAMGSPAGDVDDGLALAALLKSGAPIAAISAVGGNTTAELAFDNNQRIARLLSSDVPLLQAPDAKARLDRFDGRIVALGPLTNVAHARLASEVIIVGGNFTSPGRWPPLWPFEFNLTKDRAAARATFASGRPLTIFPLDIARQLTITREDLDAVEGPLGEYFRTHSARWFAHLRRVRRTAHFPVYDLAASLYAIQDRGFEWLETHASMNRFTSIRFGHGTRPVKVCVAIDRNALWTRALSLFNRSEPGSALH